MKESNFSNEFKYKPRRKSFAARLGRILFQVILSLAVFEGGWLLIANLTMRPVVAHGGSIENGIWVEALFLRDERLLTVPGTGKFIPNVADGSRVPRGEILGFVKSEDLPGDNVATVGAKTESGVLQPQDLDSFRKVQRLSRDNDELKADLARISSQISPDGSVSKQLRIRAPIQKSNKDLSAFLKEKNRILRTIQDNENQIQQLQSGADLQRTESDYLTAPQAGYWFSKVDGWEDRLNPDSFPGLTLHEFKTDYPLKNPESTVSEKIVCGKIVSPFTQIIAVIVDPRQTGQPRPDTVWKIVSRNDSDAVTVRKTIPLQDGRIIVALEDQDLKLKQPDRKLRIYLVYRRVSGISLPIQALYKKGNIRFVKIIKGVGYQEKKVELAASDGERAIVKGIDYGTTVFSR